jgi:PilZ domain
MSSALPGINTRVEISVLGGETYSSRIEDEDGKRLTLAAPLNLLISDLPEVGREVTVRWTGPRGKFAAPAKIAEIRSGTVSTWVVEISGAPEVEQNRRFVRGGGGEPVSMQNGDTPGELVFGRVVDVSERSVRGRFKSIDLKAGDTVLVKITLDDDVVAVSGSVLRVMPQPDNHGIDVVAVFEPDEAQATTIRRYVLRQQMLARARLADS